MSSALATFMSWLSAGAAAFTRPSFTLFVELVCSWVLCPGRRTVTNMLSMLAPRPRRAHDAYHRFLRAGAWDLTQLWFFLVTKLVGALVPDGPLCLDLDDTLFHKTGRKIDGAGVFRDAVRSTGKRVAYALGLNLVVLTLRIQPPWGGEPLGLPIGVRLHRKKSLTTLDLAEQLIRQVADWLPTRSFELCCDGAYATLVGRELPRTRVTSRIRRDAAIYDLPHSRRQGQRGRPAMKGKRLPTPEVLAKKTKHGWRRVQVNMRGRLVERLVLTRDVLWYQVSKAKTIRLVVVRDPEDNEHDDFFITTALQAQPAAVASQYAGRWSIEDTFRNVKQSLGGEDPQTWKGDGPHRAASLSLWIYSVVWAWYLLTHGATKTWTARPWYPGKTVASFADALAALRRVLWRHTIFSRSASQWHLRKTVAVLIEALARAG
ncbi:MAG: transposase [Planctomycetes bacterium]|nr:transposase [Planctomycetota bacterium]